MLSKKIQSIAIAFVAALSFNSNAALISSDWKTVGDNRATLDTVTGVEWLKLDNTLGYTLDAFSKGDYNASLQGWRLPTIAEFQSMMTINFPAFSVGTNSYNYNYAQEWYAAFGVTEAGSTPGSAGFLLASDGYGGYAVIQERGFGATPFRYMTWWAGYPTYSTPVAGLFLISDGGHTLSSLNDPSRNLNNPNAPVNQQPPAAPVNTPISLLSLALLALGYRRFSGSRK